MNVPDDLKEIYEHAKTFNAHLGETETVDGMIVRLIERIAELEAENAELKNRFGRGPHLLTARDGSQALCGGPGVCPACIHGDENAALRKQIERMSAPVTDDDRELRILKSKDALLWLEESSLNMRRRLEGKGEPEIARQSDITALYIKSLLESALLAARKGAA